MNTLSAEKRDMQIKAKKLRREGFVTGNVFGKNMEGSMPLKIEKKEAERILRTCNKGSQLILTVEGQKMPVLLKEIDYNAMKHEIVEMDFQALVKGEKVSLKGFGNFEIRERGERTGRNPRTGETMTISASKAPAFKASSALKNAVNK